MLCEILFSWADITEIYGRVRRVVESAQRGKHKQYSGMLADPVGQETRIPRASVISSRPLRLSVASDLDIHPGKEGFQCG